MFHRIPQLPEQKPGRRLPLLARFPRILLLVTVLVMCLSLVTVVGGSALAAGTQTLKVTPTLIGPPGDATGCHVNRQQNGYICTVVVSETANSHGSLQWKGRARFPSDFVINPNHGTLSPGQKVTVTIIPSICGGNYPLYFIGPHNTVKVIFTCG